MTEITPQEALIYVMIVTSAADNDMTDAELKRIGALVRTLPAFRSFDEDRLMEAARHCQQMLQADDGLDKVLETVRASLPEKAYDTAYALAIDIAAADLSVNQVELRILQLLRDRLDLDKLTTAAIERGARARYRVI
ncbi:MAG: tellurite resistance TerB family protein [Rhizobiaceae bacterium]